MKATTQKTATLILGITVVLAIIFSIPQEPDNLKVKDTSKLLADSPIGALGTPVHLFKIR